MGECFLTNRIKDNTKAKLPEFTSSAGTSAYSLTDEGKTGGTRNWSMEVNKTTTLRFSKIVKKIDVFILAGGGAGANTGGTAVGGGGYYKVLSGIDVSKNTDYVITVGTGGTSLNKAGGNSSAFGTTANGGSAAKAGAQNAQTCVIKCAQGGSSPIRFATSNNVSSWSTMSSDTATVKLRWPIEYDDVTVGGMGGNTCIRGTDGNYYYATIQSWGEQHYAAGTNGTGASSTKIFGTGATVSGPGTTSASRAGQGGGTSSLAGKNGLVVIRNAR